MDSTDKLITGSLRPPEKRVPATKQSRDMIKSVSAEYVREHNLVGPLSAGELTAHAKSVLARACFDNQYINFAGVIINNEIWRSTVAGVPYNRRLLLLPRCLRDRTNCCAEIDEFGLICDKCGGCLICEFQTEAERLGYAVLVAEGSPVVMSLIASGQIEAVIGISCLGVLERVFPYMEAGAVPGIAIPLLNDGCVDTSIDVDWAWDAIYESSQAESLLINLPEIRQKVDKWFDPDNLRQTMSPGTSQTEQLAIEWLSKAGKRWRPLLVVCAYQSLMNNNLELTDTVHKTAIAVECFHKASLIHDDIEDGDTTRYGQKTVHALYGIPIALNVGDYLLGEGYRLLAELNEPDKIKVKMLKTASQGHKTLCLGQGSELSWHRERSRLTVEDVIDTFRKKTAPAFLVALKLGTILARAENKIDPILVDYTDALGIAYQINDDLADDKLNSIEPSILLALAYQRANEQQKRLLNSVCLCDNPSHDSKTAVRELMAELKIKSAAYDLMEFYKLKAINSLSGVDNSSFKSLLRKLIGKIFNELEVMDCCDDYKLRHGRGRRKS